MVETTRVNGTVLHYAHEGPRSAPAMVFSNSLGTDLRVWDPLMPYLPEDWRRLRYDKRGHGLSALGDPWRMDDLVHDLAGLMDAEGARDAVVVGLSVGGLIAIGLAHARPDLVRGLVLCDTAAKIGTEEMWNTRIRDVREGGMAAIVDATVTKWFTEELRGDEARLTPWRQMLRRADARGYMNTCAAIRDADYRERAAALDVPALAVVGDADGSTPPETVKAMADAIPGCRFEVIDGAGHIPCVENPVKLGRLIGDFVAGL